MTTVLLVRHGRTTANTSGVLAGWTPGVQLDEQGRTQAQALAERWSGLQLAARVSSPLERCLETAAFSATDDAPDLVVDDRVGECRYGDWTGRTLKDLAQDPLWAVVQQHASAMRFPGDGGESLVQVQARAVEAVRDWNDRLGADAVYAVFSHGDVIKAVLADALGMHLDQFQRIVVDPASVSVVHYTPSRPFVERINDRTGSLLGVRPATPHESDAAVGGGAGSGE
jgi:probable phosphomutase (TIGR03848 family)